MVGVPPSKKMAILSKCVDSWGCKAKEIYLGGARMVVCEDKDEAIKMWNERKG